LFFGRFVNGIAEKMNANFVKQVYLDARMTWIKIQGGPKK